LLRVCNSFEHFDFNFDDESKLQLLYLSYELINCLIHFILFYTKILIYPVVVNVDSIALSLGVNKSIKKKKTIIMHIRNSNSELSFYSITLKYLYDIGCEVMVATILSE
jgi:hypothetical protein